MPRKLQTPSRGKKTKLPDPSLEDWPEEFYQVDVRTGVPYSPSNELPKPTDGSLAIAAPLFPPHMQAAAPNLAEKVEKRFMDLRAQHLGFDERLQHPGVSVKTIFPNMFPTRQPQPTSSSHDAAGPSRGALGGTATPSPSPSQPSRTNTRIGRPSPAPSARAPLTRKRAASASQGSTSTAGQRVAGDQTLMPPPPVPSNNNTKRKAYNTPPDESSTTESSSDDPNISKPSVSDFWSTSMAMDEVSKVDDGQKSPVSQPFDMFPPPSYPNQGQDMGLQNGNTSGWGNPFVSNNQIQQQIAFPSMPNANFISPNLFGGHTPWIDPSLGNHGQGNANVPWLDPNISDPNQGDPGITHIDPSLLESNQHTHRNSKGQPKGAGREPAEEYIPWTNPNAPNPNIARRNSQLSRGFPTVLENPHMGSPAWSNTHTSAFTGPSFTGSGLTGHATAGYPVARAPGYNDTNVSSFDPAFAFDNGNMNISPFDPVFAFNNTLGYPITGAPGSSSGFGAPPSPRGQQQQRNPFGASYQKQHLPPHGAQPQQRRPFGGAHRHEYPPPPKPEYVRSQSSSFQTQAPLLQQQTSSPYRQGHQPVQPAAAKKTTTTTTTTKTGAGEAETSTATNPGEDKTNTATEPPAAAADADEPDHHWEPPAGYRHPRTATGELMRLGTAQVAEETRRLVATARREWSPARRPAERRPRIWQMAAAAEAYRRGLRGPYVIARRFVIEILRRPDGLFDPSNTGRPLASWDRAPDGRITWLDLDTGQPVDTIDDATLLDMQGFYELEGAEEEEGENDDDDEEHDNDEYDDDDDDEYKDED